MTADDPRQQTFQLVALGDIDRKRLEIQKLIDSVPRVLAARQRASTDAQTQLDAVREKVQGFRAHLKSLELDLGQREEALSKANANLLTAKSNQEYSLLMGEITRKKEDKGSVETSILEQYDVIKQGEGLVEEAQATLEAAQAEYGEFEERARQEMAEHQKEMTGFDTRRDQIRTGIDGEVLKLYDRVFEAHGTAIVPAEANTCQGCFSTLTPNDRNRLIGGRQLVVCRVCQRILYMPEVIQASPN